MARTAEAPPIAWPSLSDLAKLLAVDLSTFSRLSSVTSADRPRLGREVKIAPDDAIRILEERGLSHVLAEEHVQRLVDLRAEAVPALRGHGTPPGPQARLTPSNPRIRQRARLMPATRHMAAATRPNAPDMGRFEQRDRELGDRFIPLERYIYDQR
ncbi:MAG: hypothetical protein ACYDAG_00965 [Chloroflexota bacterium]